MKRVSNCPNCGAILDDYGRCKFCGSIIYDFCDIDISSTYWQKTYIKVKSDNKVVIAPIITHHVDIEFGINDLPKMNIECVIAGDIITVDKEEVDNEQAHS